jgi:hypothetical protein
LGLNDEVVGRLLRWFRLAAAAVVVEVVLLVAAVSDTVV